MRVIFSFVQLVVVTVAVLCGWQASAADADHGAEIAKRWCAACHLVASDQREANVQAPTFATIAAKSDFSAEKVAFFLLDPHPKMPNFPLSRIEAADLAAYIGSLRK